MASSVIGCSGVQPPSTPSGPSAPLTPASHTDDIVALKATPNGELLVSAGKDNAVKVWSLPSGNLLKTLMGHPAPVHRIAISPNGNHLATADTRGTLIAWSLPEGTRRSTYSSTSELDELYVANDGRIATRWKLIVNVWDGSPEAKTPHKMTLTRLPTAHLFTENSQGLWSVSGTTASTIEVVAAPDQEQQYSNRSVSFGSMAVSPDGSLLAVLGSDFTLRILGLPECQPIAEEQSNLNFQRERQRRGKAKERVKILGLRFRDEWTVELLVEVDGVHEIRVFHIKGGWKLLHDIAAHDDTILDFAVSENQKLAATVSKDWSVKVWDTTDWSNDRQHKELPFASFSVAFHDGSRDLVMGGGDGSLRIWPLQPDGESPSEAQPGHSSGVTQIVVDRDQVWTCGRDNLVKKWKKETSAIRQTICLTQVEEFEGLSSRVYCMAVGDEIIATGSVEGSIRLWSKKLALSKELTEHTGTVFALALSLDSRTLVSGGADGAVLQWSVTTNSVSHRLAKHEGDVYSLAINESRQWVASAGKDGVVRISDLKQGKLIQELHGAGPILDVLFINDSVVAATGQDGRIRVWGIPSIVADDPVPIKIDQSGGVLLFVIVERHEIIVYGYLRTIRIHSLQSGQQTLVLKDLVAMNRLETERRQTLEREERLRASAREQSHSSPSVSYGHYWRPN